jgi:hypothetical protein
MRRDPHRVPRSKPDPLEHNAENRCRPGREQPALVRESLKKSHDFKLRRAERDLILALCSLCFRRHRSHLRLNDRFLPKPSNIA